MNVQSRRSPARFRAAGSLLLTAGLAGCSAGAPAARSAADVPFESTNVLEGDELDAAATSMEDMLAGRFPGVIVKRIGGGVFIEIRGPSSVNGSNQALVVIDGVQSSGMALMNMNPDDVDRIEVLKGASAAGYGVRGANGVLVVMTRRR